VEGALWVGGLRWRCRFTPPRRAALPRDRPGRAGHGGPTGNSAAGGPTGGGPGADGRGPASNSAGSRHPTATAEAHPAKRFEHPETPPTKVSRPRCAPRPPRRRSRRRGPCTGIVELEQADPVAVRSMHQAARATPRSATHRPVVADQDGGGDEHPPQAGPLGAHGHPRPAPPVAARWVGSAPLGSSASSTTLLRPAWLLTIHWGAPAALNGRSTSGVARPTGRGRCASLGATVARPGRDRRRPRSPTSKERSRDQGRQAARLQDAPDRRHRGRAGDHQTLRRDRAGGSSGPANLSARSARWYSTAACS